MDKSIFPFGTHLGRDPLPPMDEMKRDIALLAANGFTMVKLQVNWATTEPRRGTLDLARYETLIDECAGHKLGVYLGFVIEHAPHWLYREYPDCRMVGRDGTPVAYEAVATLPADGKPGPCFHSAGARDASIDYLRRAVKTLGKYKNISIWSTWQEIGHWADANFLVGQSVCFCPNTLAAFRDWLKERYHGDLKALNVAWRTFHGEWQDVMPTRTKRGVDGLPVDMAWIEFMEETTIARILADRAAAIRAADPVRRPVFAHKGAMAIGSGADRAYAKSQDFLGYSAYPAWFPFQSWDDGGSARGKRIQRRAALVQEAWASMALQTDHLRAAVGDGHAWAAELQGGPVCPSLHKGRTPEPSDIRRWIMTGLAHGLTGISFWVTRAEVAAGELNGFSLLDSEGDSTPRFAEAGRLSKAINREADVLAVPSTPAAKIAILVDGQNARFQRSLCDGTGHLPYSVRGWHRILFDLGIPADFVFAGDLSASTSQYKALVWPFPVCADDSLVARLRAYAESGGTLIAECCPGRADKNAFAVRGEIAPSASALFGVRQTSMQLVREPADEHRWTMAERTWGDFHDACELTGTGSMAGHSLRANFVLTTFACDGASPLFKVDNDMVAGATNTVGKGSACILGTVVGHSGTAHCSEGTHSAIGALLAQAGVHPSVVDGVFLRKRKSAGKEVWFLSNREETPRDVTVDVSRFASAIDLLGEPVFRDGGKLRLTVPGLDLRVLVCRT